MIGIRRRDDIDEPVMCHRRLYTSGVTCPSCGAETPAGARFCPSCGAPVVLRNDERRVVTIVFGDIVGFTTLSERLDPERVKNLVDSGSDQTIPRDLDQVVAHLEAALSPPDQKPPS